MALIKYRDPVTGKFLTLTENVNIDTEESSGVHIGEEEPIDPAIRVWYDTAYTTPRVKCKLDNGEWVEVAGGGIGTGTSTNNAVFDVKNKTGWLAKTIAYGSECDLAIAWYSEEDGKSTGNGTIQISVNDVLKTSYEIEQSKIVFNAETGEEERESIPIPIKKYLISGNNNVTVRIEDVYGNPRILKFKITTVQVSIDSSFDKGDNPESKKPQIGVIDFRYTPVGDVEKTVYFIIDGDDENKRKVYTQIVREDSKEKGFIIPEQSHGNHTFEVYFECMIDGQPVESNRLFYDIIWYDASNTEPIVASSFKATGDVKQFTTLSIPWIAFNTVSQYTDVTISDNFGYSTTRTSDGTEQIFGYRVDNIGSTEIYFSVDGVVKKTIIFTSVENKIDATAQTDFLELYLDAKGRSNTDTQIDPRDWSYGSIKAKLSNFNFGTSDGWLLDETTKENFLRVKGEAQVYIPILIFDKDCKTSGKTIEFEFATRDVLNPNSPIIQCWSGDRGIMITAQEAMLKSLQNTVSRQYKENEHIRVSFVIQNDSSGHRLIFLYIDGIQSACIQYNSGETGDKFNQPSPVGITIGSKLCTTDIYCIRVYNTYLTSEAILHNWIADTQNIDEKIERYTRNNIFNSAGRIDYQAIASLNVPYLVVDAENYSVLPDKEDQEVIISGEYIDPLYPKRNFTFVNATITPQGTSSLRYARKNYKLKLEQNKNYPDKIFSMTVNGVNKDNYALRDTSMPTNIFTFKADVASSEGANNVELVMLYDDICPPEAKTPPQKIDSRVRQGIEGYPCLMFYRNGSEYYFIGKYNFNNDKGTPEVFGLKNNKEADTYDESWEIRLNNDKMAVWKEANFDPDDTYYDEEEGKDMPRWYKAFEPRFPKKNMNTYYLERFAEWLLSTDTDQATGKLFTELPEFIEKGITEVTFPIKIYLNKGGFYEFKEESSTYREDSFEYRLTKFRHEFPNKANVDAMVFNYVFTEHFLMVDNRAKNAFPTRYDDDEMWVILPYDYDTAIGINNSGELKFGYWLEHVDGVFNDEEEGGSVLYTNIRLAFSQEIKKTYQKLRENPAFCYSAVEERFASHQKVWGEAIFNEDSRFKYIEPLIDEGRNDLPKLQGSKASQRQWWLYNRFRYFDSKYNTGDSLNDIIFMYAYVKDDIEVSPYADIYATASFDSTLSSVRALRGSGETPETYVISNPFKGETVQEGKDHIITIYSASQLASIGDIYKLKIGGNADFHNGTKLNSLLIGNYSDPMYENPNLENLSIGELKLLRKFDISGCVNYKKTVDLSGCSNLEEVYAVRTGTTAITLPNGGVLNTLYLPDSITSLAVQNQPLLKNFSLGSYDNIETLILENVDFNETFDIVSIVEKLKSEASVTITGFDLTFKTAEEILEFYDKFNKFTNKPKLTGWIRCERMTARQFEEIKSRYYDVKIVCDNVETTLTFQAEVRDGQIETLTTRTVTLTVAENGNVLAGLNCENKNPINDGTGEEIGVPTKAENATSKFIFNSWNNDLRNITGNTVITAVFDEFKKYFVTFKDNSGNIVQVKGKDGILRDTNVYYERVDENGVDESIIIAPPEFNETTHYDKVIDGTNYQFWFNHWYNTETEEIGIKNVSGDVYNIEYTAYFSDHRVYVVRFLDYKGDDVINPQYLLEGKEISEPAANDWQSLNGQYDHIFQGWSNIATNLNNENKVEVAKNIGTEDLTYYAVYNSDIRFYVITFYGIKGGKQHTERKILYQESLAWGTPIQVPTAEERAAEGYTFTEWDKQIDTNVLGNRTYTAIYTINSYTIKFVDWDGSPISTQTWNYDQSPIDPSDTTTPTRAPDAQYTYTFLDWDSTVSNVTEDKTYTATYQAILNKYTITFINHDSRILEGGVMTCDYGTVPTPPTPTKEHYTHIGWSLLDENGNLTDAIHSPVPSVTGAARYIARFVPTVYTERLAITKVTSDLISLSITNGSHAYDSDIYNTYAYVSTGRYQALNYWTVDSYNLPEGAVVSDITAHIRISSETVNGGATSSLFIHSNYNYATTELWHITAQQVAAKYFTHSFDLNEIKKLADKYATDFAPEGTEGTVEGISIEDMIRTGDFSIKTRLGSKTGNLFNEQPAELRVYDLYCTVSYIIP